MIPREESAHVRVGLLLTQVRGEFLRALPSDPEGSSRANRALRKAFELLNCCDSCYRCRTPPQSALSGQRCCRYAEEKEGRLCDETSEAVVDERRAHADAYHEGATSPDRMALRNAFLESSYLPFASSLLREVGPTWLPVWDRDSTPAPSPSSRNLFEAFFQPPAVPPSLALLALCEGLSRQSLEGTIVNTRMVSAQRSDNVGGVGGEAGMVVGATPASDARGVQHICRLMERYLGPPSTRRRQTTQPQSDEVPLLVLAVRELAGSAVGDGGNGDVTLTQREGGEGRRQRGVDVDHSPATFVGGGAAGALALALCLAPQRVANSLGPIAPPDFSPAEFFPAVSRAVVGAVFAVLTENRKAAREAATAATTAATETAPAAVVNDVWREFTARLLTAGRASDLADAWLGAMVAESHGQTSEMIGRNGPASKVGENGTETASGAAPEEAEVTVWETWAECSDDAPEAHAWMMKCLPESRRKPLTEALLRALWPRDGRGRRLVRGGQPRPGRWPPGFPPAACRVLIGRPLLPDRRLPVLRREDDGQKHAGESKDGTGSGARVASVFPGGRQQTHDNDNGDCDGGDADESAEAATDASVGLVERLLLQRPLPAPAAEAIADTLAWCDRRLDRKAGVASRFGGAAGEGGDGDGGSGRRRLLIGALKRVAAVWAEPSFLNRSPPRQQEFYTRFLLAALRGGELDGQLGGTDGDQEALVLLIRGVGSHLDVPSRDTRLRGMRVGEAVAVLSGQELRFDELDGEREDERRLRAGQQGTGGTNPREKVAADGSAQEVAGKEAGEPEPAAGGRGGGGTAEGKKEDRGTAGAGGKKPKKKKSERRRSGAKGQRRGAALAGDKRSGRVHGLPAGWGGVGSDGEDSDLDPDMLLPLGGAGSGSDSDDAEVAPADGDDFDDDGKEGSESGTRSSSSGSAGSSTEESLAEEEYGGDFLGVGGIRLGGADGDDDGDSLEAYDLWDDQDDLAKVAEPVYLDQLIEMLRSRDKPDTVDQHETALRCAEQLVRRHPPDLAHRAQELTRELLYLEDAFDLEDFERQRSGALVATVTAAPESCALYLGSEVWGTGATEGTKLQILDILVQAASELSGWSTPDGGRTATPGGSYPSALMQEARGMTPQGSIRRQQQQRQHVLPESGTAGTSTAGRSDESADGGVVPAAMQQRQGVHSGSSRREKGVLSVAGTTRRWGYRRGPREQLRRNLFGRLAPVFFYPLAQGMVLRLRLSSSVDPSDRRDPQRPPEVGRTIAAAAAASGSAEPGVYTPPSAIPPPPPPTPLFSARLLHCLTCLVELCGNCPATPALAADLLGLAWLLRGPASESRELRRAILMAVATGVERSQDGAASGAVQGQQGELLRWLQACARGSDSGTRELAEAVLGHSSVQALAFM